MKNIFGFLILFCIQAQAASLKTVPNEGVVRFEAVGKPSLLKIKGEGQGVDGFYNLQGTKLSGSATFKLDQLKTGIDLRDEHMKEKYLQTKQFPTATLTIKDLQLPADFSTQKSIAAGDFEGSLQLHGETKNINGHYKVNEKLQVETDFEIKLSDFKVDVPEYMGVKVADTVKVKVDLGKIEAK